MPEHKDIKNMAVFLFESGLLHEINRRVLNPFGLNLIVSIDEDDGTVSLGPLMDYRDEDVGIVMSKDMLLSGDERYCEFLKKFGQDILNKRLEELGFIEQKLESEE